MEALDKPILFSDDETVLFSFIGKGSLDWHKSLRREREQSGIRSVRVRSGCS